MQKMSSIQLSKVIKHYTVPCFQILTFHVTSLPNYAKCSFPLFKAGCFTSSRGPWKAHPQFLENFTQKNSLEELEFMMISDILHKVRDVFQAWDTNQEGFPGTWAT